MNVQFDDVFFTLLILTALCAFLVVGGAIADRLAGKVQRKWWEL